MSSFKLSLLCLQHAMQAKVPAAKLVIQQLPMVAEIKLALIDSAYRQSELTQDQVEFLIDDPPYWAFCWASGQVMARYLLDHPEEVKDKTVIDFGCGSGVVAIAAAIAGAARSIAIDLDQNALRATQINAKLNRARVEIGDNLQHLDVDQSSSLLLVADVFYDRDNMALLTNFMRAYDDLIIADSRVKPAELTGMFETARYHSCTVPDLAEASDFNSVGIYRKIYQP
ncbi:MAG: putative nicotinamide N-methyase [Arenicella sp.]|jgi:predicted nicotinamide N-methyase